MVKNSSSSTKKKSQTVWISISIFCLIVLAIFIVKWPRQPEITIKPIPPSPDIEEVLKQQRLFVYLVGSNRKKCTLLNRENENYHDLVAATERFSNSDCGDVRAFFDKENRKRLFVISPTQENCMCQVNYLKNKPKLNTDKKFFDDADLQ